MCKRKSSGQTFDLTSSCRCVWADTALKQNRKKCGTIYEFSNFGIREWAAVVIQRQNEKHSHTKKGSRSQKTEKRSKSPHVISYSSQSEGNKHKFIVIIMLFLSFLGGSCSSSQHFFFWLTHSLSVHCSHIVIPFMQYTAIVVSRPLVFHRVGMEWKKSSANVWDSHTQKKKERREKWSLLKFMEIVRGLRAER